MRHPRRSLELSGQTAPGDNLPAAFLEVIFTVAARAGNPMMTAQTPAASLRTCNSRPGATAPDMIGLPREVKERAVASLRSK